MKSAPALHRPPHRAPVVRLPNLADQHPLESEHTDPAISESNHALLTAGPRPDQSWCGNNWAPSAARGPSGIAPTPVPSQKPPTAPAPPCALPKPPTFAAAPHRALGIKSFAARLVLRRGVQAKGSSASWKESFPESAPPARLSGKARGPSPAQVLSPSQPHGKSRPREPYRGADAAGRPQFSPPAPAPVIDLFPTRLFARTMPQAASPRLQAT